MVAFSRVLSDVEVLVVANTNTLQRFDGLVLQDPDLNRRPRQMQIAYSNLGTAGSRTTDRFSTRAFSPEGNWKAQAMSRFFLLLSLRWRFKLGVAGIVIGKSQKKSALRLNQRHFVFDLVHLSVVFAFRRLRDACGRQIQTRRFIR